LPAIEREAREVAASLETGQPAVAASRPVTRTATFRRDGDVWSVGGDRIVQLRHSKGLAYLSKLIAEPGREFHALDLVGDRALADPRAGASMGLHPEGDRGAVIDDEAKAAYRARLRDLQAELDEADTFNDPVRADAARTEMDALEAQLAAAFGLGGRARSSGSAAERARQSVTKAIREATRRIAAEDGAIGEHLERSVRTGTFCAYDPDPATPVKWSM
jgi:non-specific serine/threonine protein kinase